MKKIFFILSLIAVVLVTTSCNDYETYADLRKKENAAIAQFVANNTEVSKQFLTGPIKALTESEFENNGFVTDVSKNEYVLFESTGVYMQIVRQGCGEKIAEGESADVLCRFYEYNVLGDSLQLTNNVPSFAYLYDKMQVVNNYGSFSGSFASGTSLMATAYSSTSVPGGWLLPLRFINVGRQSDETELAKVRLLVPASQGQQSAMQSTYPCFYEIIYQRGLN